MSTQSAVRASLANDIATTISPPRVTERKLTLVWPPAEPAHASAQAVATTLAPAISEDAIVGVSATKRMLDLGLLLLSIPLILPILAVIAIAVRLSSPGPVLFKQRRIGRGGTMFDMLKFRSMVPNAQEALDAYLLSNAEARKEWEETRKLKNDPRITGVGRFIRRTSLDELPQLWNVFKGDMSLVGPRPIVNDEAPRYRSSFRYYLAARPGCTGLWQVSGRNDTTYDERVRLDTRYVSEWSMWLDLHIIFRTFGVLFRGRGAY